jgi:hypothetical protein
MQDALQQVFREKDVAFREKDTENAFSETPLEAKCGELRQIMVLVTACDLPKVLAASDTIGVKRT